MTQEYKNKFHEFDFKTDAKRDLEVNSNPLNNDLDTEFIGDDASNESLLKYRYSAEETKHGYRN